MVGAYPSLLLHVQLLVLVLCSTAAVAHAAASASTLPTTISAGSYSESDSTIPLGGTTLNVQDMLNNASANNLTEAVFNLDRAVFEGTLTINLPTTVSSWATNNIPLRIIIHNGQSSFGTWPSTYIQVTGLLALGSNITIQGGSYHYTSQFVSFPSNLTIQDGSFFGIEGGSFRAHFQPTSTTKEDALHSIVSCGYGHGLSLTNRSTLSISHNTMVVADVYVNGNWYLQTLLLDQGSLIINDGGTVSISNNNIKATDVNVVGVWYWFTIHNLGGSITLTTNSTLSISNSKMQASHVTVSEEWWCFTVFTKGASISASHGSTIAITRNVISIDNVVARDKMYLYELHALTTPVTIHTDSLLTISDTSTSVSNIRAGYFTWVVYYPADEPFSSTTIHTNSALTVSNNNAVGSIITVSDTLFRCLVFSKYSQLMLVHSSAVIIANNSLAIADASVTTNELWVYALHVVGYPLIATDHSTVAVNDIYMSVANAKVGSACYVTAFYVAHSPAPNPVSISIFSTLSISNVHMNAVDLIVGSEGLYWLPTYFKSVLTTISDSSVVVISNTSLTTTKLYSSGGTFWHPVYGTGSSFTITAGSRLAISKNTLVKTTPALDIGPLTENLVWMSGTSGWLGKSGLLTCEAFKQCSSVQSGTGRYHCDAGSDEISSDCTGTSSPQSPVTQGPTPSPSPRTSSPTSNDNHNDHAGSEGNLYESDLSVFATIGIVVGSGLVLTGLATGTVFFCIYCYRRSRRTVPDAAPGDIEMHNAAAAYGQQQQHYQQQQQPHLHQPATFGGPQQQRYQQQPQGVPQPQYQQHPPGHNIHFSGMSSFQPNVGIQQPLAGDLLNNHHHQRQYSSDTTGTEVQPDVVLVGTCVPLEGVVVPSSTTTFTPTATQQTAYEQYPYGEGGQYE